MELGFPICQTLLGIWGWPFLYAKKILAYGAGFFHMPNTPAYGAGPTSLRKKLNASKTIACFKKSSDASKKTETTLQTKTEKTIQKKLIRRFKKNCMLQKKLHASKLTAHPPVH